MKEQKPFSTAASTDLIGSEVAKILAVGSEKSVLVTRGLVLERTGAAVQCVTPDTALTLLRTTAFDLVVLCHTLSSGQVQRVCSAARLARRGVKLLLLVSPLSAQVACDEVDLLVPLEEGPKALRHAAERLLAPADADPLAWGSGMPVDLETRTNRPRRPRRVAVRPDPSRIVPGSMYRQSV